MGGLALEETQYRVGDEVLKAVREVKKSFIDLSMAQAKVKLFDEQRVSYETALQLATRQYTAGNLSKRDKLRIHDTYARARLELMQLHRESAIARENLNRWMGLYGTQT
jgi:outer membrane protein TolC